MDKKFYKDRVMEPETISKNGVTPKDLIMSRENSLISEKGADVKLN